MGRMIRVPIVPDVDDVTAFACCSKIQSSSAARPSNAIDEHRARSVLDGYWNGYLNDWVELGGGSTSSGRCVRGP